MALYEFSENQIIPLVQTSFEEVGVRERTDLQRLFRAQIDVISPDTLILAEEFGNWQDSRRRIDLLGLDKNANFVVIELKRTEDGGLMELQAIRYAAMVSTMTFEQAVHARSEFMRRNQLQGDAQEEILRFLGWPQPLEDYFGQDTRIVLVAGDFSIELTTVAMWLNEYGVDIRCVQIRPLSRNERVFVDVQQVIPQPEAEDYQIRVRTKAQKQRLSRTATASRTTYDITINGVRHPLQGKGRGILLIVRELVAAGIDPEQIEKQAEGCQRYFWCVVGGDVKASEFIECAHRDARRNHRAFDLGRWYCREEELIRSSGRTYALSTQWGSPTWDEMMRRFVMAFPQFQISFKPTDSAA